MVFFIYFFYFFSIGVSLYTFYVLGCSLCVLIQLLIIFFLLNFAPFNIVSSIGESVTLLAHIWDHETCSPDIHGQPHPYIELLIRENLVELASEGDLLKLRFYDV
jgi:hypothetical protein